MTSVPALYCDGLTLASHAVTAELPGDGTLRVVGNGIDARVGLREVSATSRLGRVPRFLRLPGRGVVEVPPDPAFDAALDELQRQTQLARVLHAFESHTIAAATATLLVVVATAMTLWLGLPALAKRIAYAVPIELERGAGAAAYTFFDQRLAPSQLNAAERTRVDLALRRVTRGQKLHVEPTLTLRTMGIANAFALPGGRIIVSDQLVRLALARPDGGDLLTAVLAHEVAHIERRHSLQLLLRNSTALVTVATITGDLSSLTAFSATLPFLLLQRGYAREFESEADADAVLYLRAANIKPRALGDALEMLEKSRPSSGPDFTYLSTHPSTRDRIRALQQAK